MLSSDRDAAPAGQALLRGGGVEALHSMAHPGRKPPVRHAGTEPSATAYAAAAGTGLSRSRSFSDSDSRRCTSPAGTGRLNT